MSEMVERVARALCIEAGLDPERKFASSNWGDATAPHEFAWQEFKPAAREAIAAMREPTIGQLAAARKAWLLDPESSTIYRAMIDAALGEANR